MATTFAHTLPPLPSEDEILHNIEHNPEYVRSMIAAFDLEAHHPWWESFVLANVIATASKHNKIAFINSLFPHLNREGKLIFFDIVYEIDTLPLSAILDLYGNFVTDEELGIGNYNQLLMKLIKLITCAIKKNEIQTTEQIITILESRIGKHISLKYFRSIIAAATQNFSTNNMDELIAYGEQRYQKTADLLLFKIITNKQETAYIWAEAAVTAAFYGNLDLVSTLVATNKPSLKILQAILLGAIKGGQEKIVHHLLSLLTPKQQKKLVDMQDEQGKTALMYAALYNQFELVRLFIAKCFANHDLKDKNDQTAAIIAKVHGNLAIYYCLLEPKSALTAPSYELSAFPKPSTNSPAEKVQYLVDAYNDGLISATYLELNLFEWFEKTVHDNLEVAKNIAQALYTLFPERRRSSLNKLLCDAIFECSPKFLEWLLLSYGSDIPPDQNQHILLVSMIQINNSFTPQELHDNIQSLYILLLYDQGMHKNFTEFADYTNIWHELNHLAIMHQTKFPLCGAIHIPGELSASAITDRQELDFHLQQLPQLFAANGMAAAIVQHIQPPYTAQFPPLTWLAAKQAAADSQNPTIGVDVPNECGPALKLFGFLSCRQATAETPKVSGSLVVDERYTPPLFAQYFA